MGVTHPQRIKEEFPLANAVIMPKAGITVESCIIGEWIKKVGDPVNVGDVLFTYETDKASFECESTAAGTLLDIFFEEGDEVPCLVNVCAVGNPGEDTSALRGGSAADAPAEAPAAAPRGLALRSLCPCPDRRPRNRRTGSLLPIAPPAAGPFRSYGRPWARRSTVAAS